MEDTHEKRFKCAICQRTFTRNDHLKRHQLRHTGHKPYQCQFCNTGFSRSDGLRDHYKDCPLRGEKDIPANGSGGRRRHACTLCISMKLRCDGAGPCNSCQKRGAECSNPPDATQSSADPGPQSSIVADNPLDRGSIQFLLNGGSEGWVSQFHFPPTEQSLATGQNQLNDNSTEGMFETYGDSFGMSLTDESWGDIFNGPFGFVASANVSLAPTPRSPAYIRPIAPVLDPVTEPEAEYAIAMIQGISSHIPNDSPHRDDLLGNLQFLLTPSRIQRSIDLYFDKWHPNARIVNAVYFDKESVAPTLLAALSFMGALYSSELLVTYAARTLLDYVELFCFGSNTFSSHAEISKVFAGVPSVPKDQDDQRALEDLQASVIIAISQFWAGNRTARPRIMETRFGETVRIARKLDLTRCRQLPEDRISEVLWIRKESRIRTMAWIILIDCAFSFFQNYPCRLTPAELECDLPSQEAFFDSEHPYRETGFAFSRPCTVSTAYEHLLAAGGRAESLLAIEPTVLDMFILIHVLVLYAHINTQMAILTPLIRIRHTSPSSSSSSRDITQDDTTLRILKQALLTWRLAWTSLRAQISDSEWAEMGFWKHGYNYWLIAQLLMYKKDKVDCIVRMDYGEDKLEKLKVLLADEDD